MIASIRMDPATILLVDDDDGVRRILRKVLEAKPYLVVEKGLPRDACAAFDSDPGAIDLVVTDLKMPGMSGQDLAAHIWIVRPELRVAEPLSREAVHLGCPAATGRRAAHRIPDVERVVA